jgi:hypothetical protein
LFPALWNILYMDAALAQLRRQGIETKADDVARRSQVASPSVAGAVRRAEARRGVE